MCYADGKYLKSTRSGTSSRQRCRSAREHATLICTYTSSTCSPLDLSPDAFRAVSHPVCPGIRVSRVFTVTSEFPKLCRAYKRARFNPRNPHATLYSPNFRVSLVFLGYSSIQFVSLFESRDPRCGLFSRVLVKLILRNEKTRNARAQKRYCVSFRRGHSFGVD